MPSREDLHAYQERAIQFIKDKKRCMLLLSMGLGKTTSTLTAASDLIDSFMVSKVLVIAPLRVASSVWAQECQKWQHLKHLKVSVCLGDERKRIAALNRTADIYTINRENIPWLVDYYQEKWPFDMVVIDESSSFKSSSSQRFKALRKVMPFTNYLVELTGTPAPNGLMDLWAQVYLVDFGASLGRTMHGFKQRYFESDYMGYKFSPRQGSQEQIHNAIAPIALSMRAEDYLQLPQRIDLVEGVDLPAKTLDLYREFERELLAQLPTGEEVEAMNAAVLANKLLQLANGAMYTDDKGAWREVHTAKIDALKELVEANNEPMLVAYGYKTDLGRLKTAFPEAVALDKDPETIAKWNRGEIKMLLAHPACLHPETEVLTEFRGWVKIVDVKRNERVFDGVEFVSHSGCSYSGVKDVIRVAGVTLTPNHKLLVEGKWVEAKDVRNDTDFRRKARYTYAGNDAYLGEMLQLPQGKCDNEAELQQGECTKAQTLHRVPRGRFSQYDEYSNLEGMATYGESCDEVQRSGLRALRGYWSRGFGKLVTVFKFLRGYACDVCGQSHTRSDRQQSRVFKGKLSVGDQFCSAREQVEQSPIGLHGCKNAFGGILPSSECFTRCDNTKAKQRHEPRGSNRGLHGVQVSEEPSLSDVYDLVDCGPRSRFVIRNKDGDVFISHNSAGHGLNLQDGGALCVWFGLTWSLELYQQFNARLHRQGQKKPVRIVHIVANGCIDERVMLVLSDKDAQQSSLMKALRPI